MTGDRQTKIYFQRLLPRREGSVPRSDAARRLPETHTAVGLGRLNATRHGAPEACFGSPHTLGLQSRQKAFQGTIAAITKKLLARPFKRPTQGPCSSPKETRRRRRSTSARTSFASCPPGELQDFPSVSPLILAVLSFLLFGCGAGTGIALFLNKEQDNPATVAALPTSVPTVPQISFSPTSLPTTAEFPVHVSFKTGSLPGSMSNMCPDVTFAQEEVDGSVATLNGPCGPVTYSFCATGASGAWADYEFYLPTGCGDLTSLQLIATSTDGWLVENITMAAIDHQSGSPSDIFWFGGSGAGEWLDGKPFNSVSDYSGRPYAETWTFDLSGPSDENPMPS